jgi:hypothetical protein
MCWSGEASTVLATIGVSTSFYAAYKGEDKALYLALMYFSLMEALQAYTYTVINDCDNPANQIATFLGYVHVAFQPFFINAISMYFIPAAVRSRIYLGVYFMCFVASVFLLVKIYPFSWAGECVMCPREFCSVSGNWHIAWHFPLNNIGNYFYNLHPVHYLLGNYIAYMSASFVLPILYGSWRCSCYHFFTGPMLSAFLTNNEAERPAVWCLLSIGILILVVKTPIRNYLYVKDYPFWRNAAGPAAAAPGK